VKKVIETKASKVVAIFFSFILTTVLTLQLYPQSHFTNDFSSLLIVTEGFSRTQLLYSSYFDIKPPGVYLFLTVVKSVIGGSYLMWVAFYALLMLLLSFLILKIVATLFNKSDHKYILILIIVSQSISISYASNFLSADLIGLLFCLAGLYGLIRFKDSKYLILFIIMMVFAGTIKEVYIFLPLIIFSYIKTVYFKKIFYLTGISIIMTYGVIASILLYFNEFQDYQKVLIYKSEQFKFENFFDLSLRFLKVGYDLLTFLPVTFLVAVILINLIKRKLTHLKLLEFQLDFRVVLILVTSIYFGLAWQGKIVKGHVLLSIYVPLILLLCMIIFSWNPARIEKSSFLPKIYLIFGLLIASLIESSEANALRLGGVDLVAYKNAIINEVGSDKYRVKGTGCLLSVYGWDAGAYYHYSRRDPCTRYFLSPLVERDSKLWEKYRKDVLLNPPRNIVYIRDGADIDVNKFEKVIINWSAVLKNCYEQTRKDTFTPKNRFLENKDLSLCISKFY
jgi:hypothetical protein